MTFSHKDSNFEERIHKLKLKIHIIVIRCTETKNVTPSKNYPHAASSSRANGCLLISCISYPIVSTMTYCQYQVNTHCHLSSGRMCTPQKQTYIKILGSGIFIGMDPARKELVPWLKWTPGEGFTSMPIPSGRLFAGALSPGGFPHILKISSDDNWVLRGSCHRLRSLLSDTIRSEISANRNDTTAFLGSFF